MSYSKLATPVPGIDVALDAVLEQNGLTGEGGVASAVRPSLLAAGTHVALETQNGVWVSCIVFDRPETPQVDFLTVAIACRDGVPWEKPNRQIVASVFWHGVWPDALASMGIGTVRRALMMIALGEPQPQVPIVPPDEDGPTERDAIPLVDASSRSIRTAITAALELAAPVEDVL